jgi:hypothetical protein
MKVGDRVTWGACGEKATVIEMDDCVVTKVTIEYSDKSTAVVDMDELTVLESAPTAPTPPEVILEPGKEYITNNNKRLLVHWVGDEYAFGVLIVNDHKTPVYWWLSDKHYIIGPWNPKPVVDWSLHSKWTKAVAMDKDGLWYGYTGIPTKSHATWVFQCRMISIPPEYTPKNADGTPWTGNWEDSLVVRKEEDQEED